MVQRYRVGSEGGAHGPETIFDICAAVSTEPISDAIAAGIVTNLGHLFVGFDVLEEADVFQACRTIDDHFTGGKNKVTGIEAAKVTRLTFSRKEHGRYCSPRRADHSQGSQNTERYPACLGFKELILGNIQRILRTLYGFFEFSYGRRNEGSHLQHTAILGE